MKRRVAPIVIVVTLLVGIALTSYAQDYEWTGKDKLMAMRAARVDAIRLLAEQIKGLELTSETYVRDFVTVSDEIETALLEELKGARRKGRAKFYTDGSCEVTMEVPIERVVATLKHIRDGYYKGDKWKGVDFSQVQARTDRTVIRATGTGVAPGAAIEDEYAAPEGPSLGVTVRAPKLPREWEGVPARTRLMAKRAALTNARRNLAERVKGLEITSETYVRDFVTESDEVETALDTFLVGAREKRVRYLADLIVEVEVQMEIERIINRLKQIRDGYYEGDKWKGVDFSQINRHVETKTISAVGHGTVPEPAAPRRGAGRAPLEEPQRELPDWVDLKFKAEGIGVAPDDAVNEAQAEALALRAAKVDALRNLSEKVHGARIDAETTVEDFITTSDEIEAEVAGLIRGAEVVKEEYDSERGSACVEAEIDMGDVWDAIQAFGW